jgi:hypothetical protein
VSHVGTEFGTKADHSALRINLAGKRMLVAWHIAMGFGIILARFCLSSLHIEAAHCPSKLICTVFRQSVAVIIVHMVPLVLTGHNANLEISSFKCGHDAPIYGVIEGIIEQSGTPYFCFKDLDENKPAGSIKIRVETIDYFLRRYREDVIRKRKAAEDIEAQLAVLEAQLKRERGTYVRYCRRSRSSCL